MKKLQKRLDVQNTFELKKRPAEDVSVVVGDEKKTKFYPRVKTKHWENKVNFSIGVIDDEVGEETVTEHADGMIEWQKGGKKARFYDRDKSPRPPIDSKIPYPIHESEDGSFEFDLEIATPIKGNTVPFSIQTKGLRFLYQPKLTHEELISKSGTRAINVECSYAVYHDSKQGNEYGTGKAFHIYRPLITDAEGRWVWGDLNIKETEGILEVVIPDEWLENAAYPIIVDPTLGYTTKGASAMELGDANTNIGAFTVYSGVDGTLDSIHVACETIGSDGSALFAVHIHDDTTASNQQKVACGSVSVPTGNSLFKTLTTSSEVLSSANEYLIGLNQGNAAGGKSYLFDIFYDTDTADTSFTNEGPSGPDCTATTITIDIPYSYTDRRLSAYITYTETGGTDDDDERSAEITGSIQPNLTATLDGQDVDLSWTYS